MLGALANSAPPGANELAPWIRLEQIRGIGTETARKLLTHFGLPENIFAASIPALREVVSERLAAALTASIDDIARAAIAQALQWAQLPGNRILTLADADYPAALLQTADPPLILYVKGRIELLSRPSLAVVGSRNATVQGINHAEQFSDVLSQAGLTIISGMALGIDTAAHQGALQHTSQAGGSTIAVIGTGIDIVYPARNRPLAHQIAQAGCIISEYPLGTPAIPANFPRRNRIISGLARGVLVVEAAIQSGSLITARLAAEQGRDVFAIPGSIHSPLAKGCHLLIKQGAKLVESAQDILEEYRFDDNKGPTPGTLPQAAHDIEPTPLPDPLLDTIGFDPIDIETLAHRAGLDAASLHGRLLNLELLGWLERLPGEIYRRLK